MAIRQISKSLQARHSPLADTFVQLDVLNTKHTSDENIPSFATSIARHGFEVLRTATPEILQVNVGKRCNQTCNHCHVDAGPDRKEVMSKEIMLKCLAFVADYSIKTVDITGGAPELHPHFQWFVESCRALNCEVIHRCNLTIIFSNPKYLRLPEFFAAQNLHLVCSLPHFNKLRTDAQRGAGVFDDSIRALQRLNEVGYGIENSGLILDLVHNPSGAFLPGDQNELEQEFKRQLYRKFGITFNHLFSITNLPISRFLEYLIESDNYEHYLQLLVDAFNPQTLSSLMCRNTISVSWEGFLYDCDFNQMLDLKINGAQQHISNFNPDALSNREIVINQHCYGCTAGAGSGCGGALV